MPNSQSLDVSVKSISPDKSYDKNQNTPHAHKAEKLILKTPDKSILKTNDSRTASNTMISNEDDANKIAEVNAKESYQLPFEMIDNSANTMKNWKKIVIDYYSELDKSKKLSERQQQRLEILKQKREDNRQKIRRDKNENRARDNVQDIRKRGIDMTMFK